MKNETWKTITDYPSYEVSDMGKIRRKDTGKVLKPFTDPLQEYPRITLYDKDGRKRKIMVHLLVAQSFVQNPLNKPFVDHINTDRHDCRASNLRYVTAKENEANPITAFKRTLRWFRLTGKTKTAKQLSLF